MASQGRLRCGCCGAGLVPAWNGLRCPRLAACGRGGYLEDSRTFGVRRDPAGARLGGHPTR